MSHILSNMLHCGLQLMDQLVFYGQYHSNPMNQLIHFVFVPTIMWTVLVWLAELQALEGTFIHGWPLVVGATRV